LRIQALLDSCGCILLDDSYTKNFVALADFVDHVDIFNDLTEARVAPVEMCRTVAAVADKKRRAAGSATAVRHGTHAAVMVLIVAVQFTFDGISWSAGTRARRVSSLDDEIGDNPVERYAIVVARLGQL